MKKKKIFSIIMAGILMSSMLCGCGEDEEKSRNILKTLIKLAQRLQLDVVVEGVETKEQVDFLREVGNCQVQGYYFSKPVPSKQYISMLINT